jgi:hypothetical protein
MEGNPANHADRASSGRRARALVALLLTRLDTATDSIEALDAAFRSEDAHRALAITITLKNAWRDAHLTIAVMEQVSGCTEVNARRALLKSHRSGRVLVALTWNLISHLSPLCRVRSHDQTHNQEPRTQCSAPAP